MGDIEDRIQKLELDIPDSDGSRYNRYKGEVYMLSRCPSGNFVNEDVPVKQKLFEILNVFYWNGVPEEFLEPIVFHELREAEEMYGNRLPFSEAHKIAKQDHMAYAKRFLDTGTLGKFVEWQSQFPEYQNGD
jgi:hypothetical protein